MLWRFRRKEKPIIKKVSVQGIEMPIAVRAAKPTLRRKKVLFVCSAGSSTSPDGQCLFAEVAGKEPLNAHLLLDHTGYVLTEFRSKLAKSDFVVPMGPPASAAIEKALKGLSKKPCVVDVGFQTNSDSLDKSYYIAIRESMRRKLEKKEKKK